MTSKQFQSIIEQAGYEPHSYSGRGMYGKSCVGYVVVTGNLLSSVASIMAYQAREALNNIEGGTTSEDEELFDDLENIFMNIEWDNMGLGMVVYFPSVIWE